MAATQQTDLEHGCEPTLSSLLGDIMEDLRSLGEQQMTLAREEVKRDLAKLKAGALWLGLGAGTAAIGLIFLLLMAAHLLNEVAGVPLWAGYLIVGGVLCAVGLVATVAALKNLHDVHAVPRQSARALKETVQCLIKPK